MSSRIFLVVGVLLLTIQLVFGHGYLQVPASRNLLANKAGKEFCPHCLSSGGVSVVQGLTPGGKYPATETTATAVRHTMCGESANIPASQRLYNPAPVPTTSSLPVYKPGQTMDIVVQMTAHHRGHFEFRLCDASKLSDPKTVTWACLNQNVLKRVAVAGEVSPVDVNHPERYYLEPECAPRYNKTITMKYQIPSTLTCERCILQWWWVSANTCNPPDYGKRSPQPAHVASGCQWWQSNLPLCGTSYPEEFWNCADIRVSGTASPGGNTVPPPSRPSTAPAKPAPARPAPAPKAPAPKAPAPKAPSRPSTGCAALGTQCGGAGWTGPKCCKTGTCMAYMDTYSQCRTGSCPAGWLCNKAKDQSLLTNAVEYAKSFFE